MSARRNPITDYDRKPLPPSPITLVPLAEMVARIEAIRLEEAPPVCGACGSQSQDTGLVRRCGTCQEVKPIGEFYRYGPNRQIYSQCRPCHRTAGKDRRIGLALRDLERAS